MIPNAVGRSGPQPAGAGPAVMTKREPWMTPSVHPAADKLPMMSDAELAELAADIKANGLLEPIVVWEDNTEAAKGGEGPFPTYLLDGRNRLAALKLLGITDPHDAPTGKGANTGRAGPSRPTRQWSRPPVGARARRSGSLTSTRSPTC